jgi:hypothetical protein
VSVRGQDRLLIKMPFELGFQGRTRFILDGEEAIPQNSSHPDGDLCPYYRPLQLLSFLNRGG